VLLFLGYFQLIGLYLSYILILLFVATLKYKSLKIGIMSVYAMGIQFYGYGKGFLESTIKIQWLKKNPEVVFPKLFFK